MQQTGRIIIPELRYPFPPAINAHAETIHEATVEWVGSYGLAEERTLRIFRATGIGRLAARTHPEAAPEDLRLISDWYAWLFFRDDAGDEERICAQPDKLSAADFRLMEVLGGAEPVGGDTPLAYALADLRERLLVRLRANSLSRFWMRRFARAVGEHLEATLWEAANRAQGVVPDLESYVRMRPLTGGLQIVTELVEIVEGTHLPAEVRRHETVAEITGASHNVSCWANDIISLPKELAHGEVNNLVVVLQNSHGLGLQESVDRAGEMHDAEVRRFLALEREMPSFGPAVDDGLRRYVSSLRARMRGILDWSWGSERYRLPGPGPTNEPGRR